MRDLADINDKIFFAAVARDGAAVRRQSRLVADSRCHYCDEVAASAALFCGVDCRDHYGKEQDAIARRPRHVATAPKRARKGQGSPEPGSRASSPATAYEAAFLRLLPPCCFRRNIFCDLGPARAVVPLPHLPAKKGAYDPNFRYGYGNLLSAWGCKNQSQMT